MRSVLICLIALCSLDLKAQAIGNVQQSIRDSLLTGIFERSPLGRFMNQDFSPGVKSFDKSERCIHKDLKTFFMLQQPPWKVRFPSGEEVFRGDPEDLKMRDYSVRTQDFEDSILNELRIQLGLFDESLTDDRELCVESAVFSRPNAVSIGFGFLVFDPHIFLQIASKEDTNEWSMRAIIAHEFAHQLQVWARSHKQQDMMTVREIKEGRVFVRDKELQADCIAAGILSEQSLEMGQPRNEVRQAITSAFVGIGDFDIDHFEGHHGTAWERSLMAAVGFDLANTREEEVNLSDILESCRIYIQEMNEKYSDEIWPMGSSLD